MSIEGPGVKSEFKVCLVIAGLAIVIAVAGQCGGQTAAVEQDSAAADFPPLEAWRNSVLTGDAATLKKLYSTSPPAEITSSAGKINDAADIDFWMVLKARSITLEIAETNSPQPDVRVVVFQAEVSSGTPPNGQTVYVKEGQVWRKQEDLDQWRLAAVERSDAFHLKQVFKKDNKLYPADADAHADIKQAEAIAAKEHKRVLLVFGANWCYDCYVLDLAFHRPEFSPVMDRYEVVHVDIGPDGTKNADLTLQYGIPLDKGVPALVVLDSVGKLVVSQKNGELKNARATTPAALLEFLNKWKPPGL
ncbi:MAG: thioredoxin family protein [Acidobacteriia bacterium]|nr:thioredoxin family protein [Terriglobia bacterium]